MLNYGPWASHQCFNYERYNADFKGIRTNGRKGLERTLVKRLLKSIHHDDVSNSIPPTGRPELDSRIKQLYHGKDIGGSRAEYVEKFLQQEIQDAQNDENFDPIKFISFSGRLDGNGYETAFGFEQLPASTVKSLHFASKSSKLPAVEFDQLFKYYDSSLADNFYRMDNYPQNANTNTYSIIFNDIVKFKSIELSGQKYNSKETNTKRGSVIHAFYKDPNESEQEHRLRPAEIQYFFAYVRWFASHSASTTITTFDTINSTTYTDTFLPDSELCILPVHCIHSPAGIYRNIIQNYNVIIKFYRKIVDC